MGIIAHKEYPCNYEFAKERYFSINDNKNYSLKNKKEVSTLNNVIFGGRLENYKYLDFDDTIRIAISDVRNKLAKQTSKLKS